MNSLEGVEDGETEKDADTLGVGLGPVGVKVQEDDPMPLMENVLEGEIRGVPEKLPDADAEAVSLGVGGDLDSVPEGDPVGGDPVGFATPDGDLEWVWENWTEKETDFVSDGGESVRLAVREMLAEGPEKDADGVHEDWEALMDRLPVAGDSVSLRDIVALRLGVGVGVAVAVKVVWEEEGLKEGGDKDWVAVWVGELVRVRVVLGLGDGGEGVEDGVPVIPRVGLGGVSEADGERVTVDLVWESCVGVGVTVYVEGVGLTDFPVGVAVERVADGLSASVTEEVSESDLVLDGTEGLRSGVGLLVTVDRDSDTDRDDDVVGDWTPLPVSVGELVWVVLRDVVRVLDALQDGEPDRVEKEVVRDADEVGLRMPEGVTVADTECGDGVTVLKVQVRLRLRLGSDRLPEEEAVKEQLRERGTVAVGDLVAGEGLRVEVHDGEGLPEAERVWEALPVPVSEGAETVGVAVTVTLGVCVCCAVGVSVGLSLWLKVVVKVTVGVADAVLRLRVRRDGEMLEDRLWLAVVVGVVVPAGVRDGVAVKVSDGERRSVGDGPVAVREGLCRTAGVGLPVKVGDRDCDGSEGVRVGVSEANSVTGFVGVGVWVGSGLHVAVGVRLTGVMVLRVPEWVCVTVREGVSERLSDTEHVGLMVRGSVGLGEADEDGVTVGGEAEGVPVGVTVGRGVEVAVLVGLTVRDAVRELSVPESVPVGLGEKRSVGEGVRLPVPVGGVTVDV